jgi:2-polyprenyl-3-methyl-5-hydroxy-6-metoxy-1,4-benzoquinol methylase
MSIREATFSARYPVHPQLTQLAKRAATHQFLVNPASQTIYRYQVEFVRQFTEHCFREEFVKQRVLDWGCGKGHVTFLLKDLGANVTSCDYKDEQEAGDIDSSFGQATPIIDAEHITVVPLRHEYRLPFEIASFDVVLSFGVLEHVPHDFESLTEIVRVLRPGGLFFCFNLPYVLSWTQRMVRLMGDNYHDRLYSKRGTRQLLAKAGLDTLEMWHRQLFPKNTVSYPAHWWFEMLDQRIVGLTPLKYLATNIEFVARKP